MKYVFKVGDRGVAHPDLPEKFANKPFTVVGELKKRPFVNHDNKLIDSYLVTFDYNPDSNFPMTVTGALLPPPKRGDMDVKIGWDELPEAVVKAMKGEK